MEDKKNSISISASLINFPCGNFTIHVNFFLNFHVGRLVPLGIMGSSEGNPPLEHHSDIVQRDLRGWPKLCRDAQESRMTDE